MTAAFKGPRFLAVVGDSMQPEMRMGDIVGYVSESRFSCDDLYVVDFGHGPFCMNVMFFHTPERGPHIRLNYQNPRYQPQTVALDEIDALIVGRVFAVVKVHDREMMERAGVSLPLEPRPRPQPTRHRPPVRPAIVRGAAA